MPEDEDLLPEQFVKIIAMVAISVVTLFILLAFGVLIWIAAEWLLEWSSR